MAQEAGSEAITVVIEKLTEIVEGSHTNKDDAGKTNTGSTILAEHLDNNEQASSNACIKSVPEEEIVLLKEQCEVQSIDHQQYIITQEENGNHLNTRNTETNDDGQEHPDKENDSQPNQHIIFNFPQGLSSLNSTDPQALLQTLMHMTSSQVVGSPGHTMQAHNGQVVETIGAEMVIPASIQPDNTVTVDIGQDEHRVVQLLSTGQSSSILHLPSKGKQSSQGKALNNGFASGAKKEVLKCAKCDYCSHNKHYLKQHVDLVHNADRPFKCPFCDYAGKRSHSLKEHLVVHSTNRPFECPICNASFRKKGHLTNHIRLHNTFKYFECSICQEKFKDKSQLYAHLRVAHDPSQVYECKVCEYATTIKSNIVMHMHTHGNPEVYRCNICSFTALHINILKQHMQTHSANNANLYKVEKQNLKARPVILLKCSVCGYTTDKKEALQNHMWQHLPEEATREATNSSPPQDDKSKDDNAKDPSDKDKGAQYKCTECSYSCQEAYLFITHMLAHHPRQKLIADQQKQQQQQKQQESSSKQKDQEGKETMMAFTHDSAAGMYRCTICGYMCEQQRTIKAHIWKHSGHKDIDYPMFQNGPISVYDDTPVGKAVLLSEKSKKPPIKVIPRPKEDGPVSENQIEDEDSSARKGKAVASSVEGDKSVTSLSLCTDISSDSQKSEKKAAAITDLPGIVRLNPKQKQTAPLMGAEILQPVLASQPIKWTLGQFKTAASVVPLGVENQAAPPIRPCVRFVAPIAAPGRVQPVLSSQVSPSASNPEIVQLILGAGQTQTQLSSGLLDQNQKRKLSVEHPDEKDTMVGVAKRICLEEVGSSSSTGNVVVQQLSQIYTTPTITIASSPLTAPQAKENVIAPVSPPPSPEGEEGPCEQSLADEQTASGEFQPLESPGDTFTDKSEELETDRDSLMVTEVVIETRAADDESSSNEMEEELVVEEEVDKSLINLLEKGANSNPACPSTDMEVDHQKLSTNVAGTDTDPSDADSEHAHSEESKRKKGICSSLLAVIEQLRERSKSESEGEAKGEGVDKGKTEKMNTRSGSKRKSRCSSAEDDTPIEQYKNVEKIKSNPIQYRCKLCHYSSNTTNVIKNHMRLHKTKQPFECSLCDHQAESSEGLQEHMLQHCKVRTYHCKVCPAVFNYKSQLRAHMRAHNEKEPFLCDLCDYETSNPIAFRNHNRVHAEKKEEAGNSTAAAASAVETVAAERGLGTDPGSDLHKELACDECDYEATSNADLMLHIRNKHPVTYKCDQCEKQCSSWSSFSAHLKMHLEVRTLKCELCDFVATSMRSLKSHMKRHVNDQRFVQQPLEQYKCNLCGYVCHHLPSLKSHMWRHASDKNYSYQLTNDVINAAIDYDTNPTLPKTPSMNSETSSSEKTAEPVSSPSDTDVTDMALTTAMSCTTPPAVQSVPQIAVEDSAPPTSKTATRPCLVTFRCCQCGFESLDKSVLNDHMKTHLDIIRKTLEVNKSRLVARAMKEMGHSAEKENSGITDLQSQASEETEGEGSNIPQENEFIPEVE